MTAFRKELRPLWVDCGSSEVAHWPGDIPHVEGLSHRVGNDESRPKESGASAAHVAQCEVPSASFMYFVLRMTC